MNTQPEALRLADALKREWGDDALNYDTALGAQIELLRLHAANVDCINHFNALKAERDELLVAVCRLLEMPDFDGTKETSKARMATKLNARATIAKVAS